MPPRGTPPQGVRIAGAGITEKDVREVFPGAQTASPAQVGYVFPANGTVNRDAVRGVLERAGGRLVPGSSRLAPALPEWETDGSGQWVQFGDSYEDLSACEQKAREVHALVVAERGFGHVSPVSFRTTTEDGGIRWHQFTFWAFELTGYVKTSIDYGVFDTIESAFKNLSQRIAAAASAGQVHAAPVLITGTYDTKTGAWTWRAFVSTEP